ncbi:hypothetical protein C437_15391 [Haloarcula vallismortis ATCC 29715]|uniref:Uncharacterized protein n=1 Tax=Haloarcula vallismortis ATCC 29715 TaxID=662477 RepID=M0IYK4_HALVA|nr:hypothetical protein [Haloarcula vallismortis]EMA01816.1 hypothetical protein C437_15391 [Haloarcula vallismortis ATCC 29715]
MAPIVDLEISRDDVLGVLPNSDVMLKFLNNPRNFVLGAILSALLEGIFGIMTAILNGIIVVLAGTQPAVFDGATEEQIGMADLPVAIANAVIGSARPAGDAILSGIESLNEPIFNLAGAAGVAGPIVIAAIVVAEVIVVVLLLERVVYIIIDVIPGGGGLIK